MKMRIREASRQAKSGRRRRWQTLREKIGSFRTVLFRCYWKLERTLVPGLRSSQYAYYETLQSYLNQPYWNGHCRWLDLGCGHQMFPAWMNEEEAGLIAQSGFIAGLDYDLRSLRRHRNILNRAAADIHSCPLQSGVFDLITANMVVEHLEQPAAVLAEVKRVLKPGGLFVFHTPNYRHYLVFIASLVPDAIKRKIVRWLEMRQEEDVFPTRYRLNTPARIQAHAEHAGMTLLELSLENTSAITGTLGPLAIFELFVIRLLEMKVFKTFRPDIVAVLQKPESAGAQPATGPRVEACLESRRRCA